MFLVQLTIFSTSDNHAYSNEAKKIIQKCLFLGVGFRAELGQTLTQNRCRLVIMAIDWTAYIYT